jgi:kynurenine 3-monooxygenase
MHEPVTILGGGCTGPLLALLVARRGYQVQVYERRPDARRVTLNAGRSINLALAARGIATLERAGLMPRIQPLLVPMRGRMVHDLEGGTRFLPYGQRPHELLWSVGRTALNHVLMDAAEEHGVEFHFEHACRGVDFARRRIEMENLATQGRFELPLGRVLASDGSGSTFRAAMAAADLVRAEDVPLAHGYKELTIPADANGQHQLALDALHIWPRGGYMLIALPNPDGTFTATLFLADTGPAPSFAALAERGAVRTLFERDFPDVLALMPDLETEYAAHPVGRMSTVYVAPWHHGGDALLIGDAAHAIVPFHGQGMNCAFEDCAVLDDLLAQALPWDTCFSRFDAARRPDTAAIARMALENYVEMRDTVRDPRFALQTELSLELERRCPGRFIPRYSMVMFHAEIGYADAERRGAIQARLLDAATLGARTLADIDFVALEAAIGRQLPPL